MSVRSKGSERVHSEGGRRMPLEIMLWKQWAGSMEGSPASLLLVAFKCTSCEVVVSVEGGREG